MHLPGSNAAILGIIYDAFRVHCMFWTSFLLNKIVKLWLLAENYFEIMFYVEDTDLSSIKKKQRSHLK